MTFSSGLACYFAVGAALWLLAETASGAARSAYRRMLNDGRAVWPTRFAAIFHTIIAVAMWPVVFGQIAIGAFRMLRSGQ